MPSVLNLSHSSSTDPIETPQRGNSIRRRSLTHRERATVDPGQTAQLEGETDPSPGPNRNSSESLGETVLTPVEARAQVVSPST